MISIRLARGGRVHNPIYTIVATDARNPRDGRFIEKLGQYSPSSESVLNDIKTDRIAYWVSKGGVLSSTVETLLKKNKISLN